MEVGRLLSSSVDAWADLTVSDVSAAVAHLQLVDGLLPQLRGNVQRYFETLAQV